MADKLFYTMGQVAEMFDVKLSLIRHWESQFSIIRPKRNKKGNRLFTPRDVENFKMIYHLVKERGMTLEGAKKALKMPKAEASVSREAELLERLQHIRAQLVEVRESLKGDGSDIVDDSLAGGVNPVYVWTADDETNASHAEAPAQAAASRRTAKPVIKIEPDAETMAQTVVKSPRKPRRKKEDAENKELFAFYEQSLF